MAKKSPEALISTILNSSEGHFHLARAMAEPLRKQINYPGMSGGIFKSKCCVCLEQTPITDNHWVGIGLKKASPLNNKTLCVCDGCFKSTKVRIRAINKLDPKELPLFISDENAFVREHVIKRLKKL